MREGWTRSRELLKPLASLDFDAEEAVDTVGRLRRDSIAGISFAAVAGRRSATHACSGAVVL